MGYLEFPSEDEWAKLLNASPAKKFRSCIKQLEENNRNELGIIGFMTSIEVSELIQQLIHRLNDTITSYAMLTYYYSKGIPDKNWYISPGKNGSSVQYYPDFNNEHFYIKEWFDYYSDIFYYKLFSAWDLVGHILNTKYTLNIKKIDFQSAINALKQKENSLYLQLKKISNHPEFKKATKIRNDITHNYLPGSVGLSVNKTNNGGSVGIREYTTSTEIVENTNKIIDLFEETLICIS